VGKAYGGDSGIPGRRRLAFAAVTTAGGGRPGVAGPAVGAALPPPGEPV